MMKYINRGVVIIKPKQPYIDWANSLDDGGPTLDHEEARREANLYLIKEYDDIEQSVKYLKKHYSKIFENELYGWMTDPKTWPQERTFRIFNEWFDIEVYESVCDLEESSIIVEEL